MVPSDCLWRSGQEIKRNEAGNWLIKNKKTKTTVYMHYLILFKVNIYSGTWIFWLTTAKKLTFDMYYWIHLFLLAYFPSGYPDIGQQYTVLGEQYPDGTPQGMM